MDPQFGELVNTIVDWGVYIPEMLLYAGYKIILPWVGLFSVIAKFTPTNTDNKLLDRILNVVHTSALNPEVKNARYSVGFKKKK